VLITRPIPLRRGLPALARGIRDHARGRYGRIDDQDGRRPRATRH